MFFRRVVYECFGWLRISYDTTLFQEMFITIKQTLAIQYESKKISAPEIVNVMYTIQNYDLVGEVAIVFYTSV